VRTTFPPEVCDGLDRLEQLVGPLPEVREVIEQGHTHRTKDAAIARLITVALEAAGQCP